MNFSINSSILRFVFIFLGQEIFETNSLYNTIFSDSLTENTEDVFCFFNSTRLYKIYKNHSNIYIAENDCTIEDYNHKKYIYNFLSRLNNNTFGFKKKIDIELQSSNLHERKYFYLKIINLRMTKSIYMKLHILLKLNLNPLIREEDELAQIIHSHSFSYVDNNQILLKEMILAFLDEKFDLTKYDNEIYRLEKDQYKIVDEKCLKSLNELDLNLNNPNDKIIASKNVLSSMSANSSRFFPQIYRNLYNFIALFFNTFYIIIIDEYSNEVMKYSTCEESISPVKIEIASFNKLLCFCMHPQSLFEIKTINFDQLHLLFSDIFDNIQSNMIFIDFTYILTKNLRYFTDISTYKENKIRLFFKNYIQQSNIFIKIDGLNFQYNIEMNDYKIIDFHRENIKISLINKNTKLMTYLDLFSENLTEKLPLDIHLLIKSYVKVFFDNHFVDINNIAIIRTKRTFFTRIFLKVYNLFIENSYDEEFETDKQLHFNDYITSFVKENDRLSTNFFVCNRANSLTLSHFQQNICSTSIFLFGKFCDIEINTNKMIDLVVKKEYFFIEIFETDHKKDIILDKKYNYFTSTDNMDELPIERKVFNYNIRIHNENFRIIFDDFIFVKSLKKKSKFVCQKSQQNMPVLTIQHCEIEFLEDIIPKQFFFILIENSIIKFRTNSNRFESHNNLQMHLKIIGCKFPHNFCFDIGSNRLDIYESSGNIKHTHNANSSISILKHIGQISLNNNLNFEFLDESSFYKYNSTDSIINFNYMKYLHKFNHVKFFQPIDLITHQTNFVFLKCRFNRNCKFFLRKNEYDETSSVFEILGHEGTFHNYIIHLCIFYGEIGRHKFFYDNTIDDITI